MMGACASKPDSDGKLPSGCTVECQCGSVEIRFENPVPRFHLRCCCVDCTQRIMCCEQQGGPKVPPEVAAGEVPPDLKYMDNRFEVLRGLEKLGCTKLREGAAVTNCVSKCCNTVLLFDHPAYQGNAVGTCPQVAKWQGVKETDPQMYTWVKDWNAEAYPKLNPKLPGMYIDHSKPKEEQPAFVNTIAGSVLAGELPDGTGFAAFMARQSIAVEGPGMQFSSLPGAESPTILGLTEGNASHGKTGCTVECQCGSVEIRFKNPVPRFHLKCCCVDCLQKMTWCEQQGGPKVPPEVAAREVPSDSKYMDNRFEVLRGLDKLSCMKLREGAASTNCMSKCCHTLLMVEHPFYQGNSVMMYPQLAKWQGVKETDPQMYCMVKDWNAEAYPKLNPKLPGVYIDHSKPKEEQPAFVTTIAGSVLPGESPDGLGLAAFVAAQSIAVEGSGMQFSSLPGAQSPTILGLAESNESHGKTA